MRSLPLKSVMICVVLCGLTFASAQAEGSYREAPCPPQLVQAEVEGETVVCGVLEVPERHGVADANALELAVLILKAHSRTPEPDPVIFLQGGPGGAALSTVEFWADLPWRSARDIILIDQRGTGYGEPNLKCPELYRNLDFGEAASDCAERISASGYDLNAFNSRENAADISLLFAALNIEQANLYGVSYGTRLALTIMRDVPERVRSVVLDSTYPPQAERLIEFGPNFERALGHVFASCAADPACDAVYPDLEKTFFEAVEEYGYWTTDGLALSSQDLLNLLFQAMYDESIAVSLPYAFRELSRGNDDSFALILSGLATAEEIETGQVNLFSIWRGLADVFKFIWREVQSEGVYFSTECPEDVLFQHPRAVERAARRLPFQLSLLAQDTGEQMFTACRAWGLARAETVEAEAVVSSIPTLVLAGSFDPITPPEWGQRAAKTLNNSYFFEFKNAAHGVFASGDCPVNMVQAFLNNPSIQPNPSCMDDIELTFYVPEEAKGFKGKR